jgi:predicted acyltransferase
MLTDTVLVAASIESLAGEQHRDDAAEQMPRLRSLDVFRGVAVLGMILVNAADLGGDAYPFLRHAEWEGLTLADLVFPCFLFIVGAAMGLSMHRASTAERGRIYLRVLRRTLLLFALGLGSNWLHASGWADLRIMGVLQRIALCYAAVAFVLLRVPIAGQYWIAGFTLLGYWALLACVDVPAGSDATMFSMNLPSYIDRVLIGDAHLLRSTPYDSQLDPEGLLSTLPAVVSVLAGVFCARWLSRRIRETGTSLRLFGLGAAVMIAGWAWSVVFPINKALWTSSFVLVSSGLAAMALAVCFELVDVRSRAGWLKLCEVLGLNAIAAYLLSTWIDIGATEISVPLFADEDTPYVWLRNHVLDAIPAPDASLLFALAEILIVSIVMYAFYRRSWFLRI